MCSPFMPGAKAIAGRLDHLRNPDEADLASRKKRSVARVSKIHLLASGLPTGMETLRAFVCSDFRGSHTTASIYGIFQSEH